MDYEIIKLSPRRAFLRWGNITARFEKDELTAWREDGEDSYAFMLTGLDTPLILNRETAEAILEEFNLLD